MENKMAGKLYKGSVPHKVYEGIMTHPSDEFTGKEIFDELDPKPEYSVVITLIGGKFIKMGIVEKTDKKKIDSKTGRSLALFRRKEQAKQPIIYDPDAEDHLGNSKPKRKRKKKAPPIPETINAMELGTAIIDYIAYLKERVSDLALSLRSTTARESTQIKEKERTINALRHQIDGLKKENDDLRTKLAGKTRTFNTKDVLDFKKRKALNSGLGN